METDREPLLAPLLSDRPPRGWIRWVAVVLALVGWWFSLDLVKLSLGLSASTPWLQAECGASADPSETFDCQSVLNSSWASIPLSTRPGATRIPTATFGMGYFAFVGLWYLFVGAPTRSRWARHLLITAVIGCGAATSVLMIYMMGSVLHKWCGGCLVTHVANGGLLLLTIVAFPWTRDRANVAPHPRGRLALATLAACTFLFLLHPAITLVLLAGNSANRWQQNYTNIVDDPEYVRWQYERQPVQARLTEDPPVDAGDPGAPNTVVVFVDYQCPACKSAYDTLKTLMQEYPGALRISYRHFPLDRSCNDDVPRSSHPVACRASAAAEAARVVGGSEAFRAMRELLYQRLDELEQAPYARWAAELGIDESAFSRALESEEVASRIQEDIELGKQLGVKGIPVFFLNGRRLHYWSRPETWKALLRPDDAPPAAEPTAP
jgi:protein-disulfide isomerase/uncharacterized membrane protein